MTAKGLKGSSRKEEAFAAKKAAIRGRHLKILVVDDIPSFGNLMAKWLSEEFGAEVTFVDSGPAALADIDKNTYHCVFLDLMMPKMDGVQTALRLKNRIEKNRIVIMSGDPHSPEWAKAEKLGFEPIPKPFTERIQDITDILDRC